MAQLESIVDTHQRRMQTLAERTERQVAALWRRYGTPDPASVEFAQFLGAARRVIGAGRRGAADAAEVYYAAVRGTAPAASATPYNFVDASDMDAADNSYLTKRLTEAGPTNVQKAMLRGESQAAAVRNAAGRVADVAGQYAHYADRASIVGTARRDPATVGQRYYRIAHSGCCPICAIAAARGAVYHTDKRQFHTACRCTVAPALPGQRGPVGVGQRAAEEYDALSKRLGRSPTMDEFGAHWDKVSHTATNVRVPAIDRPKPTPAISAEAKKWRDLADANRTKAADLRTTAASWRNDPDPKWRQLAGRYDAEADELDQLARSADREARVVESGMPDPTPRLDKLPRFKRARDEFDPDPEWAETNRILNVADDYRVTNPHRDEVVNGERPYNVNCSHASTAYELRRRGYDVEASARPGGVGRNPTDYANRWVTKDGHVHGRLENRTRSFDQINAEVESWPDGARGFVTVNWKGGGAHVFNVERVGPHIIYAEGQVHMRWDPAELVRRGEKFGLQRIDDLIPTDDLLELVVAK